MQLADPYIVGQPLKMAAAVFRVDHLGGNMFYGNTAPVETHHDFDIKVHPLAEGFAAKQGLGGRQWIDSKAAHGIADIQAQGLDPDPKMGQVTAVEPTLGHGIIILRQAGDQRLGVELRPGYQRRNIFQIMLAVGVHL